MALKKAKQLRVFCIFHEMLLERASSQLLLRFLDGGGGRGCGSVFPAYLLFNPFDVLGPPKPCNLQGLTSI